VRAESRDLGRRAAEEIGERLRTPEVASAPPEPDPAALPMTDPVAPGADATAAAHDGITHSDRERLDRLIEEKLREE